MNPHDQSPNPDSARDSDQPPPGTQPKPPTKSDGTDSPERRLPKPRKKKSKPKRRRAKSREDRKRQHPKSRKTNKLPKPPDTAAAPPRTPETPAQTVITDLLHRLTIPGRDLTPGLSHADRRTLQDLAVTLAGAGATGDSVIELLVYFIREHVLAEISKKQFLSNDLMDIRGGFGRYDYRVMRVNGGKPVDLDRREYILIKLFADHALQSHDAEAPDDDGSGLFLPVDDILRKIDALKAHHAILGDVWNDATYATIHHVIFDLRNKLRAAQLNPNLIESRSNGAGYRISTRLSNITLRHGSTDSSTPMP